MSRRPKSVSQRAIIAAFAVAVLAVPITAPQGIAVPVRGAAAPASADIETSGLLIVDAIPQARPTNEDQAQALSDALDLAEANPDDVGYPWIDPTSGTIELSAASAKGDDLIAASRAAMSQRSAVRHVKFSFGQLEKIKHEITNLVAEGVPGASLIFQTAPDHLNSRIIISVAAPSEVLFAELTKRYGTDAIAIQIDNKDGPAVAAGGRQSNASPFWGGAKITTPGQTGCSDSFAWTVSTTADSMLTAAHCIPSGGAVSTPAMAMGSVTSGSGENWSTTTGTTYYTGQSTYRGDVALIRITSPKVSAPLVFVGPSTSISGKGVKSWRSRYSVLGDVVYVSGATTGETGPFTVDSVGVDRLYIESNLTLIWARNITQASKYLGTCPTHGDSGGSVYSLLATGVIAAGTYSGFGVAQCTAFFTDIYRSFLGLPGTIVIDAP
ncbi:MAG: trypsin-like serine protease [Gemmatimonadota bacterium]